jgi:hypothetical protein
MGGLGYGPVTMAGSKSPLIRPSDVDGRIGIWPGIGPSDVDARIGIWPGIGPS